MDINTYIVPLEVKKRIWKNALFYLFGSICLVILIGVISYIVKYYINSKTALLFCMSFLTSLIVCVELHNPYKSEQDYKNHVFGLCYFGLPCLVFIFFTIIELFF